jgi:hypothetical protein
VTKTINIAQKERQKDVSVTIETAKMKRKNRLQPNQNWVNGKTRRSGGHNRKC